MIDDQPGPERELRDREDDRHDAGRDGPEAVDRHAPAPARARSRSQWTTMPACDRVIEVKTPIAYSGISASTRPPNATSTTIDEDGQGHDPGAEREPLAAEREPAGHEPVARQDRRQPREVGEARVGGQDQDAHRRELQDVVGEPGAEHRPADLRDDRLVRARDGARHAGEVGRPRNISADEDAHDGERRAGVAPLRSA